MLVGTPMQVANWAASGNGVLVLLFEDLDADQPFGISANTNSDRFAPDSCDECDDLAAPAVPAERSRARKPRRPTAIGCAATTRPDEPLRVRTLRLPDSRVIVPETLRKC